MKKIIFIVSLLVLTSIAFSQQRMPGLLVKKVDSDASIPLRLSELKVSVSVIGNRAETTMEMLFYNDNNRILEGDFYFPIRENEIIYRFALEVDGKMREGVVVEKNQGRQIFESVVRQKIDPGLLEWTKGNNFKARIYPIPAKGYRKIIIGFHQELKKTKEGFTYFLPLEWKAKLDSFSIRAEILKQTEQPVLSQKIGNMGFTKWQQGFVAEFKAQNYVLENNLSFILPEKENKVVWTEKDNRTGKNYFSIYLEPKISSLDKKLPQKIALFWDSSDSVKNKQHSKEIELLESYFKKIGNVSVDLILFANDIIERTTIEIKNADVSLLKDKLLKVNYDGGTQLGKLDFTKEKCDEIILVSDGISNFGKSEIILSSTPVIVINSSYTAEHSYLHFIALKTGGIYLNLTTLSLDEAKKKITQLPYSFIKAEYQNHLITEVYPSISQPIFKDFVISGILLQEEAEIKLFFGFGQNIVYTETIIIKNEKLQGNITARCWASQKMKQLEYQYEKNREQILELGKTFSLVSRETSLLVLERIEDYVAYRVIPFEEELKKQYFTLLAQVEKQQKELRKNHIEDVVRRFETLKQWWLKDFPMDQRVEKPSITKKMLRNGGFTFDYEREQAKIAEEPEKGDKKENNASQDNKVGVITLAKWNPDTPYLKKLRETPEKQYYSVYLELKKDYANSSAFFLDVADFFIERQYSKEGLRILSNIAEMELENPQLLRILGHRLAQMKQYALAASIFEEVLKMRPEEPQSYRDLALVYASLDQKQKAIDLLYQIVEKEWDSRFPDIELIALNELNAIISSSKTSLDTSRIDKRLIFPMPCAIRVVLNWDADLTDMDLWVTDPNGEKTFFSNPISYMGGRISRDFTGGYGPEEFLIKKVKPGKFIIEVNYYGNTQQILAGAVTIQVEIYYNWGKKNQIKREITMRLQDKKEVLKVGEIEVLSQQVEELNK